MARPVYKLLDEKGRVLIPREVREKTDLQQGDIVKLSVMNGRVCVAKVDIVEAGKQDAESVEAFIHAAVKNMSHEKQVALASRILRYAENNQEETK
jgi:AbrB family looped-hinge helix DNA binding protein